MRFDLRFCVLKGAADTYFTGKRERRRLLYPEIEKPGIRICLIELVLGSFDIFTYKYTIF